jgi:protein-tyrosine-phosphatase
MAAAFFNRKVDRSRWIAASAGTEPAKHVHPQVVEAMRERGFDLSGATPQRLTPELAASCARLVTMGCGERCPVLPGVPIEDWPLPDPRDAAIESVRAIRDQIEMQVDALILRLELI